MFYLLEMRYNVTFHFWLVNEMRVSCGLPSDVYFIMSVFPLYDSEIRRMPTKCVQSTFIWRQIRVETDQRYNIFILIKSITQHFPNICSYSMLCHQLVCQQILNPKCLSKCIQNHPNIKRSAIADATIDDIQQ